MHSAYLKIYRSLPTSARTKEMSHEKSEPKKSEQEIYNSVCVVR